MLPRRQIEERVKRRAYEDFIMSFMTTSDSDQIPHRIKLDASEKSLSTIKKFMRTERDANRALFIIQAIIELRTIMIMDEHC